jgi:lysine 2,3-aminomutase
VITALSTENGEAANGTAKKGEMQDEDKQDKPPSSPGKEMVRITAKREIPDNPAAAPFLAVTSETQGGKPPRFPKSRRSQDFHRRFFPDASDAEWSNWRWQLRNCLRTPENLLRIVSLTSDELQAMTCGSGGLPTSVTPYYASLLSPDKADDPVRRTMIPSMSELIRERGEKADPLAEEAQSPIPGLVHRYPDRVLFMATEYCSAYCRYCTRSRLVGQRDRKRYSRAHWERALAYIRSTPAIRDVIVSGGDPLTLPDEPLEWLLINLRAIRHIEVIRLGSKIPAVLPMRVTPTLVRMLRRANPLWMSLHFTHPAELTPETAEACSRLADAGLPLGSQTVLLKGINDDPTVMRRLMTGLMRFRVRPYYLYQCDPIIGSRHFRTPLVKGMDIVKSLRGHVSGYAVPQYVVDAPGGGGKIPVFPNCLVGNENGDAILRNYQDRLYRYPDQD